MTDEIHEMTYEDLLGGLFVGQTGRGIERRLKQFDEGGSDGHYTVYWPKDSIRVIVGADYATARAVACVLRDARTLWAGVSTDFAEPVVALIRRNLGNPECATREQVKSEREFKTDHLLPDDIRVPSITGAEPPKQVKANVLTRFDFATLPDN